MSLPKAGKVPLKGPQSISGFPMPKASSVGAGSSPNTIKTLIQQGTAAAGTKQHGPKGYGAGQKPDTSGNKIKKVIQTSTSASTTKK